ncbi:MAG: ribonuclease P protein component [Candidatus Promineifilaceae bacterium]
MLPQRYRLRRHADLVRVRQTGQAYRHPLAVLLVASNETVHAPMEGEGGLPSLAEPPSRFAFTASRHVGPAVTRNRAKRLLREAVRQNLEQIQPGWDCVWIVRTGTAQADFKDVCAAVGKLLSRAGLLAAPGPD